MSDYTIRPYLYPLLAGAVPANGAVQTVIKTATVTIPNNSKFVWTHTLNATLQTSAGIISVRVMLYDSVKGPVFSEAIETTGIAGAIYKTFSTAPRDIRPFPLPETYTFEAGSVLNATYTVILTPNGGNPDFANVGIILCGYRLIL